MHDSHSNFPRALVIAATALAASAALLFTLAYFVFLLNVDGGSNTTHTRLLKGSQFKTIFGDSVLAGDSLRIITAAQRDGAFHVLVTNKSSPFRASDHPVVQHDLQGLNAGLAVNMIWRVAGRLYTRPVSMHPSGVVVTDLSKEPAWQGTVSEIGFHIQGDLRGKALELREFSLLPHRWMSWWRATWSGWTAYRGFTPSSINVLYGAADRNALSPTFVTTAWAAMALLLLYLAGRRYAVTTSSTYAIALLLPWIAMDLLWQRDLSLQLEETRHQYGGMTMHERHLNDRDASIYQYVGRLKRDVLPTENSRVFLLHREARVHNFERLKTQYYLLPHNVFNFGNAPPDTGIRQGDYVLRIGELPDLEYRDGHLRWAGGKQLPAVVVDEDPLGTLYRVNTADERRKMDSPGQVDRG